MLFKLLVTLAPFLTLTHAHIQMNSVNGVQGAVRKVHGEFTNSPVFNPQSPDMVCGIKADAASATVLPVAAGSKVTTKWFHVGDTPGDIIIDPSHKGPCNFYMAKLEPGQSLPTGAAWFKIYEDGFSNGDWCTMKLIKNRGILDVTIPAQISAGKYLLRGEINALHEADGAFGDPSGRAAQFYVHCAELQVSGGGNMEPSPKTVMPYLTTRTPGVKFDMYNNPGSSYPTLGIPIARFSDNGAAAPAPPSPPANPSTPAPPPTNPNPRPGGNNGGNTPQPPTTPQRPPTQPSTPPPSTPNPPPSRPAAPSSGSGRFDAGSGVSITTVGIESCWTTGSQISGVINFAISINGEQPSGSNLPVITATLNGVSNLSVGDSWNAVQGSMKAVGGNSVQFATREYQPNVGMVVNMDGVECVDGKLASGVGLSFKAGMARR
ncbi:hypothetical protein HDV05_006253 [Chytridiales sp. JEL 0842]|nr:hypothetical protein HDV05_006253 [Chytridiales sp. JEL 0842]